MTNEISSLTKAKELWQKDKPVFLQNTGLFIFSAALPFSVSLIQGGLILFMLAGLWRAHAAGNIAKLPGQIKANPLFIPWMIYLAAGIIAAAAGIAPARSFPALNSDLLTAVSFFGLCLFLEPAPRNKALNIYTTAVTAAAAWGIAQAVGGLLHGQDILAHANSHHVRYGEIMVIGLALTLARLFSGEELSPRFKKALYTAAALIAAAIVLSQTRGAYLGAAMVFAALYLIRPPARRQILTAIALAAVLGLSLSMFNPSIRYKVGSIFRGANSAVTQTKAPDQSIGTRLILWRTGFKIIKDYPIFGAGPANVKKLFPVYCPPPYPENQVWGSLHNLYIHQTAERGFVGLAALLTLFAAMLITALRRYRAAPAALTAWAITIMLPYYLMNCTEITFQHVHTSYAVLLALAVAITSPKPSA